MRERERKAHRGKREREIEKRHLEEKSGRKRERHMVERARER